MWLPIVAFMGGIAVIAIIIAVSEELENRHEREMKRIEQKHEISQQINDEP